MWAKSALGLAVVAVASGVAGQVLDTDTARSAVTSLQIQQGADSLGRLTPFLVILSVFAEPARYRKWSFLAMLVWAVAAVVLSMADVDFFYAWREVLSSSD